MARDIDEGPLPDSPGPDGVEAVLDRRCFLKWSAILGTSALASPFLDQIAQAGGHASLTVQDAPAGIFGENMTSSSPSK